MEAREEGIYCPVCEIRGDAAIENRKLKISFTNESIGRIRWGKWGQKLHKDNIAKSHKEAVECKELLETKRREYADYKSPLVLQKFE